MKTYDFRPEDTWVVIGAATLEHLDTAQRAVEAALPDGGGGACLPVPAGRGRPGRP